MCYLIHTLLCSLPYVRIDETNVCKFLLELIMKMKTKLAAVVIGSMAMFNVEASVSVPMASASATIDWSSFAVAGYPIGPNPLPVITWSNEYSSVYAYTDTGSESNYAADWTTELVKHAGNIATFSDAVADTLVLHSYSEDADLSSTSQANSSAYRQGDFSVAGSGFLVFSVNYTLDASLEPGNDTSNYNNNYANANVYLQAQKIASNVNDQYTNVGDSIYLYEYNFANSPVQSGGTLNLALLVNDGEAYHISAGAGSSANVSSVPLPSAVWLFMSALLGFLGLTRRKSALIG